MASVSEGGCRVLQIGVNPPPLRNPRKWPRLAQHSTPLAILKALSPAQPQGLRYGGRVMLLEDGAAGLDRIDDAVGKAAGFHRVEESIDDFVPGCVSRERVSVAIGQNFRIALANGSEEHHTGATGSRRHDA